MGQKNKLKRFADLLTFPNVYENFTTKVLELHGKDGEKIEMKGKWDENHFKNGNPITLELACGGGEYTLGLARMYPNRNFIGVDIKGARIWKGARVALADELNNVGFLRTRIEVLSHFVERGEIEEIWITFPDPFLRESKSNRRLTSPFFLDEYRKFMLPGSIVHLKTDSPQLYEFTLETLEAYPHATLLFHDDNIYNKPLYIPELEIKTFYEHKHLEDNRLIKYVKIRLD